MLLVNLLWNVIIMIDYLYILIVVLVSAWLWKKFNKHMAAKPHNKNNGRDEALSNVVTEEDFDTEPAANVAADADYLVLALDKGNEAQIAMREKKTIPRLGTYSNPKSNYIVSMWLAIAQV